MAILLALLSSSMWGVADFIGGLKSRRLPAFAVFAYSQAAALVIMVAAMFVTSAWTAPTDYLPWAIASSIVGMVGLLAFYTALAIGPMGIVAPIASMSVMVPVGVGLVRGESPSVTQLIGVLFAVIGILLASGPELSGRKSARAVGLAALSAIGFGFALVTIAEGSATSTVMTMLGMRTTSVTIAVVVALVLRSTGGLERRDVPALVAVGILDVSANLAFGISSTLGLLSLTSVAASLYSVVTAVLAAIFLRERLRPIQYAGGCAAIIGIVLVTAGG